MVSRRWGRLRRCESGPRELSRTIERHRHQRITDPVHRMWLVDSWAYSLLGYQGGAAGPQVIRQRGPDPRPEVQHSATPQPRHQRRGPPVVVPAHRLPTRYVRQSASDPLDTRRSNSFPPQSASRVSNQGAANSRMSAPALAARAVQTILRLYFIKGGGEKKEEIRFLIRLILRKEFLFPSQQLFQKIITPSQKLEVIIEVTGTDIEIMPIELEHYVLQKAYY